MVYVALDINTFIYFFKHKQQKLTNTFFDVDLLVIYASETTNIITLSIPLLALSLNKVGKS